VNPQLLQNPGLLLDLSQFRFLVLFPLSMRPLNELSGVIAPLDCSDLISAAPIFRDFLTVAPTVPFDDSDADSGTFGLKSSESVTQLNY
jgi:hypothetical protein